jgi:hydrogenase maturation protease
MKNLILGVGSLLRGDGGVGLHAARALMETGCPDDTSILEIGTAFREALPAMEEAERIVIIDAVKGGREPGTVYRMSMEDLLKSRRMDSMHCFNLARLLDLVEQNTRPKIRVIGVEPAWTKWSLELSPAVASALPAVLEAVGEETGCDFRRTVPEMRLEPAATRKPPELLDVKKLNVSSRP